MTTALNLTLPIKQDAATLQKLAYIKQNFAVSIQPMIDAALRKSEIVHYARVLAARCDGIAATAGTGSPGFLPAQWASAHWWATPGTGTNVDPRSGAFWPE